MERSPDVERQAMAMLLAGDHPVLATLRAQFDHCLVGARRHTGIGFYTRFVVPDDRPRLWPPRYLLIDDVSADVDGLEYGCGFALHVARGLIAELECHLWGDDALPENARYTRFYYVHQPEPPGLAETRERDMEFVATMIDD